jgi:hypothetical protein
MTDNELHGEAVLSTFAFGALSKDWGANASLRSVTEIVLEVAHEVSDVVLEVVEETQGYWTEFFWPEKSTTSMYGHLGDIRYPKVPDHARRMVWTNLHVERLESGENWDVFGVEKPTGYLSGNVDIPDDALVRVWVRDAKSFDFQVDNVAVIPGKDGAIVKKLNILPVGMRRSEG